MRAVFNFRMVLGGSSGGTMIGVSSDAAGATATAAAGTAFGIYFRSFSTTPQRVSNGSFADIAGAPALRAVDYTVTVTVDQMWISVVARSADGTDEIRTQRARSGFTVNNLFIFQSDSRELTGMSVGYVGARKQFATIAPRTSLEGVAYTTHWTGDGTNKFKLTLPLSYDSRVPQPVVILFHGNGSDENHFADNSNGKEAGNAFLAAGYATISAAAASLTTWGNAASTSAYVAAYRFFRDRYSLGPVLMYSNSMGAIESLNALADGRIPGVVGWATTHPAISLKSAYDDLFSVGFTALIKTAYGIAADGSDYASKTAGRDAMLLEPGLSFRGVPMWVLYATDDAAVDQSRNAIPFVAKIQAIGVDIEVQTTTGGHSAAIAAFMTSLTNFADDCIGR